MLENNSSYNIVWNRGSFLLFFLHFITDANGR